MNTKTRKGAAVNPGGILFEPVSPHLAELTLSLDGVEIVGELSRADALRIGNALRRWAIDSVVCKCPRCAVSACPDGAN